MTNLRKSVLAAVLLGAGALTGCGGGYYRAGVVVGPPPPPVYGPVGYAPGPGYVWMGGYYDLNGGRWYWRDGHWGRPPRPGAVYVTPYWERHGGSYRYHQGHWRR